MAGICTDLSDGGMVYQQAGPVYAGADLIQQPEPGSRRKRKGCGSVFRDHQQRAVCD